jgi:Cu-Zn family superoxide dismutase
MISYKKVGVIGSYVVFFLGAGTMRKEISFLVATLVASQGWAQSTQTGRNKAEEKAATKMAQDPKQGVTFAEATLTPKSGSQVAGTVLFNRGPKGLQVIASITGGTPGKQGFHIHEKGDCSAPDASSAGGHFNPTGATHADPNAVSRHAGDLGNITVKEDGVGYLLLDLPPVKGFTNWDEIIGKSVVVHAKLDDLKSQPAGAAGDRIACGVIQAAKKPQK